MDSDERLLKKGRLADWENQAKILSIKIHGIRQQIHAETDQYKPIESVDVSKLRVALDELCDADLKLMDLTNNMRGLRADLGIYAGH